MMSYLTCYIGLNRHVIVMVAFQTFNRNSSNGLWNVSVNNKTLQSLSSALQSIRFLEGGGLVKEKKTTGKASASSAQFKFAPKVQ